MLEKDKIYKFNNTNFGKNLVAPRDITNVCISKKVISSPIFSNENDVDYKIGNFKQGISGDCWFLSAISNLKANPNCEKILEKTITPKFDKDGIKYNVTFQGAPNNKIEVKEEELDGNYRDKNGKFAYFTMKDSKEKSPRDGFHTYQRTLSSLDKDVLILEVAMNKYINKIDTEDKDRQSDILSGGYSSFASELLTGEDYISVFPENNCFYDPDKNNKSIWLHQDKNYKKLPKNVNIPDILTKINPNELTLSIKGHSYDVVKYEKKTNTVILINPNNTESVIKKNFDEIKNDIQEISLKRSSMKSLF